MDWTAFPYFLAVAREGSLRAAAETLGATHATVDRQLRGLEQDYGVRLFDRSPSGMVLTEAGKALVPMAEEAEGAVIGARARLMGLEDEAAGQIHVSVPPVMAFSLLPEIFAEFSDNYPEIDLRVTVTNKFEDPSRLEADVSIRVAYDVTQDVVGRKIVQTAIGIYGARDLLARGSGLSWVGWDDRDKVTDWIASTPYADLPVRHVAREVMLQFEMIRRGMGIGYLPVFLAESCEELVRMPGTEIEPNRWIWLLLHTDLRKTTRVRLFVDHVATALKARRHLIQGNSR